MVKNVEKIVIKDRNKRMRLRRITRHLQALAINDGQLRLVLLEDAIAYLRKHNMPYSKREIYSAFRLVPKDEYTPAYKNQIINKLTRDAQNGSVFTKKQPPRKPQNEFSGPSHAFMVFDTSQNQTKQRTASNRCFV